MSGFTRREFQRPFHETRDRLFRYLLRLCRNRTDAEDLLQETYMAAWRKRRQYRGSGSLEGFLREIGYRLYLNQRTKVTRRASLVERNGDVGERRRPLPPDQAASQGEGTEFLIQRVQAALDRLPDRAREAFVMHRLEGLSVREIADVTSAPLKTIESRLRRATDLLAAALERHREDLPTP